MNGCGHVCRVCRRVPGRIGRFQAALASFRAFCHRRSVEFNPDRSRIPVPQEWSCCKRSFARKVIQTLPERRVQTSLSYGLPPVASAGLPIGSQPAEDKAAEETC